MSTVTFPANFNCVSTVQCLRSLYRYRCLGHRSEQCTVAQGWASTTIYGEISHTAETRL
ncbi:hypothetical protein J6590_071922 [Homalodisca vitripennis]|nr:hypothetical protein J6590_071922 [Homalodisca vitripennis]